MALDLHTDADTPSRQDSIGNGTSELTNDLRDYLGMISEDDGSHISSSRKSPDGCLDLLPPPPSQLQCSGLMGGGITNQPQSAPAHAYPQSDEGDPPAWMLEKGRWKYTTSTADVPIWKELLKVYLRQEHRLELTDIVGKDLSLALSDP